MQHIQAHLVAISLYSGYMGVASCFEYLNLVTGIEWPVHCTGLSKEFAVSPPPLYRYMGDYSLAGGSHVELPRV